jgi:hypothetical protein
MLCGLGLPEAAPIGEAHVPSDGAVLFINSNDKCSDHGYKDELLNQGPI